MPYASKLKMNACDETVFTFHNQKSVLKIRIYYFYSTKDSCGYACHQDYKCDSDNNSNNFTTGAVAQPENVHKLNESIVTKCFKCDKHYAY